MNVEMLSRIQFAFTVGFHYLFPPLSIGLGLILVIMEAAYLRTKKQIYEDITKFWAKIFGLIFALGVATGIVMEFQFGTNWATYSRFVGDIFGSALAAEGVFAFFLESGFLAILLFGWNRVKPKTHFMATVLVCFGAHFSAIWIVVANSWQQTPAGYHLVQTNGVMRAELTSFWQAVINPSFLDRIWHVYMGAWQTGAFLVLSVSAWYLLKNRHRKFAIKSIKIGLVVAVVASLLQLVSGDESGRTLATTQPTKLAAMEGHFESEGPAALHLFGWVNEEEQKVDVSVAIPGMLSFLVHGSFDAPVKGVNAFPPDEIPPVNTVFQSFHAMVAIGFALILIALLGLLYWWRKTLFDKRWLLWIFVFSVLLPEAANQLGWVTAEVGRQPFIVYKLLRTAEAYSPSITSAQVITSLVLFGLIYLLLFILFIFLLNEKIQHGFEESTTEEGHRA